MPDKPKSNHSISNSQASFLGMPKDEFLAHIRAMRAPAEELAQEQGQEVREAIAPNGQLAPEPGSLFGLCGYPTDLTRTSPFFPVNPRQLGERDYLENFTITAAGWGEILYTGPRLSTYDEDALLALLAILEQASAHRIDAQVEGKRTYTYRGPLLPILRLMGYKSPGKDTYKQLLAGLKRLMGAIVELRLAKRTKDGRKAKTPRVISMAQMLSNVHWDEDKKELTATVNPYFFETYYAGAVTLLDVQARAALAGSIAKALYRFVQSHRSPIFDGHFLTLAQVLNVNTEQPVREIRRLLKRAIKELCEKGILDARSGFMGQDMVKLIRATSTPGRAITASR